MTQPNIREVAKQQRKNFLWSVWFPYPSSWLKSFILIILLTVIIFLVKITGKTGYYLAKIVDSPEIFAVFGIMALLLPIPTIAFVHHILHLFIGRFLPAIQTPEIGKLQGLAPGIISWWEGLYGWVVILLSTLTAAAFCSFLLPLFNLSYAKIANDYSPFEEKITTIFGIIWIVNAALLYQFEYLVKLRIISANSVISTDISHSNINVDKDVELNRLRGEMGLHKIKSKKKSPQ